MITFVVVFMFLKKQQWLNGASFRLLLQYGRGVAGR